MTDIRWTDKDWLDSNGNIQSFGSPIVANVKQYAEKIVEETDNKIVMEVSRELQMDIDKPRLMAALHFDKEYYQKYWNEGYDVGKRSASDILDDYLKLNRDMKIIKSVTDEYNFEEAEDESNKM